MRKTDADDRKRERSKRNEEEEEEETFAVVPPNGGWGWVVVLSAFYCNIVLDGIQLTFGVFLKTISRDFDTQSSAVALAGSLMFGIHLLMGPVCAGCNSAFGIRPVTITGSLICCFGVGISYFSTGYWYLYISFGVIGGMGLGLIYMNTLVITSLYFTTLMPVAIGIVVCGTGIGTMAFAAMGSFLLSVTTWQNSFLIEAALAGSMGIAAMTFRPLKPVRVKIERKPSRESVSGVTNSLRGSLFIKTEQPTRGSVFSVVTIQNLAWSFAENVVVSEQKRKGCTCCKKRKKSSDGSVLVLSEVRTNDPYARRKSYVEKIELEEEEEEISLSRRSSMSYKTVYTRMDVPIEKSKETFWKSMKQTIVVIVDCRLLASFTFFVFTVSGAIILAAFLIVFIYEKDRCEDLGFSDETSVYFVMALGAVNVFWRLLLGCIAILPKVRFWAVAISGLVLGGVGTMVSGYNSNMYFQFAFCFVFGLGMGSFAVFRIPMTIDLVGMEFLENATGINLMFMGVFCIAFPPIFGLLQEATNSYNVIFMITGSLIVLCALTMIGLKKIDTTKIKNTNSIVRS